MSELAKARTWWIASWSFYAVCFGTAIYALVLIKTSPVDPAPLRLHVLWIVGLACMVAWGWTGNSAARSRYARAKRHDQLRRELDW